MIFSYFLGQLSVKDFGMTARLASFLTKWLPNYSLASKNKFPFSIFKIPDVGQLSILTSKTRNRSKHLIIYSYFLGQLSVKDFGITALLVSFPTNYSLTSEDTSKPKSLRAAK